MKKCANCGEEIEEDQTYYRCLDNYMQTKFFDDEETENIFCSQECFCKYMTLVETY